MPSQVDCQRNEGSQRASSIWAHNRCASSTGALSLTVSHRRPAQEASAPKRRHIPGFNVDLTPHMTHVMLHIELPHMEQDRLRSAEVACPLTARLKPGPWNLPRLPESHHLRQPIRPKMPMTNRERFTMLLKRMCPDRVPWFGDLDYWYHAAETAGTLPEQYRGDGYFQLNRDLGVGFYLQGFFPFTQHTPDIHFSEKRAGDQIIRTMHTPRGDLTEVQQWLPTSFSWGYVKHYVGDAGGPAGVQVLPREPALHPGLRGSGAPEGHHRRQRRGSLLYAPQPLHANGDDLHRHRQPRLPAGGCTG